MATLTARKGMEVGTTDPEEQALLRAVCATPFDDLPRLRMADWLEERGDVERSEFIRVQCEIERLETVQCHQPEAGPKDSCNDSLCPRCGPSNALYWRERELLEYFAAEDMAQRFGLRPHETLYTVDSGYTVPVAGVELKFSRGFVSRIECTLREFMGDGCGCIRGRFVNGRAGNIDPPCRSCGNTGHITGLVDTLFAVQPIEQVTISDREPYQMTNGVCWLTGNSHYRRDEIPNAITSHFQKKKAVYKVFPTRADALAALSRACVSLGRSRAKLPPI